MGTRRDRARPGSPLSVDLRLEIYQDVLDRVRDEILANPRIEVGGKLVGFVKGSFDARRSNWQRDVRGLTIIIAGYLDDGPKADQSAVHHFSDTSYQLALYQTLLRRFDDLEFLGIWHSHHPNGLRELSNGDIQTASDVVNSSRHTLDFLVSSLAFDADGLDGGRHFLFCRGHRMHYEIGRPSVHIRNDRNQVAKAIDVAVRELRTPAVAPPAVPPQPDLDSPRAKQILVADSAWINEFADMRPYLRDGSVVWRGPVQTGPYTFDCFYGYPAGFPDSTPIAEASMAGSPLSLRAPLSDRACRRSDFLRLLSAFTVALRSWEGGASDPGTQTAETTLADDQAATAGEQPPAD